VNCQVIFAVFFQHAKYFLLTIVAKIRMADDLVCAASFWVYSFCLLKWKIAITNGCVKTKAKMDVRSFNCLAENSIPSRFWLVLK